MNRRMFAVGGLSLLVAAVLIVSYQKSVNGETKATIESVHAIHFNPPAPVDPTYRRIYAKFVILGKHHKIEAVDIDLTASTYSPIKDLCESVYDKADGRTYFIAVYQLDKSRKNDKPKGISLSNLETSLIIDDNPVEAPPTKMPVSDKSPCP